MKQEKYFIVGVLVSLQLLSYLVKHSNAKFLRVYHESQTLSTNHDNVEENLIDYVDTRIGSGGSGYGIGSLNPGAQVPFGAFRLGPDTSLGLEPLKLPFTHFGGYYYNDDYIEAFSHTHMVGSGALDFGNFGVMVTRNPVNSTMAQSASYRSTFTHATEDAKPGYYAVDLLSAQAHAEMTAAGTHSGIHRYNCKAGGSDPCIFLLDVCHTVYGDVANVCRDASLNTQYDSVTNTFIVKASVLNHGALSGRSPRGGIKIWLTLIISAVTHDGTPVSLNPGYWLDSHDYMGPTCGNLSTKSGSIGAFFIPSTLDGVVYTTRAGVSFISDDNSEQNIYAEQCDSNMISTCKSFETIVSNTQQRWENALRRVTVVNANDISANPRVSVRSFYTAVYHTFCSPTTYTEWNGEYLGFDNKIHVWPHWNQTTGGSYNASAYLSDMSIWDTHRTHAPWLLMAYPEKAKDTLLSLLDMTQKGGHLPRWPLANVYTGCMIGSHAIVTITDAALKWCSSSTTCPFSLSDAYDAIKSALDSQDASNDYSALGYVPLEKSSTAASLTLAFAFDDGVAARMADLMGDNITSQTLHRRGQFYRNIWNNDTRFLCPRHSNGSFVCPALPSLPYPIANDYTEGNAWQWRWFVPHDIQGLISLFGGPDAFVNELQTFMSKSNDWVLRNMFPNAYYWAGNEPDILAPWLFSLAGNQYSPLTQNWTQFLNAKYYPNSPAGLPGNDDYGTMSAWKIWSSIGIYPLAGSNMYILSVPMFQAINISIPASSGNSATINKANYVYIKMRNSSPDATYASGAMLNGIPLSAPKITHQELMGSVLEFCMVREPSPWNPVRC